MNTQLFIMTLYEAIIEKQDLNEYEALLKRLYSENQSMSFYISFVEAFIEVSNKIERKDSNVILNILVGNPAFSFIYKIINNEINNINDLLSENVLHGIDQKQRKQNGMLLILDMISKNRHLDINLLTLLIKHFDLDDEDLEAMHDSSLKENKEIDFATKCAFLHVFKNKGRALELAIDMQSKDMVNSLLEALSGGGYDAFSILQCACAHGDSEDSLSIINALLSKKEFKGCAANEKNMLLEMAAAEEYNDTEIIKLLRAIDEVNFVQAALDEDYDSLVKIMSGKNDISSSRKFEIVKIALVEGDDLNCTLLDCLLEHCGDEIMSEFIELLNHIKISDVRLIAWLDKDRIKQDLRAILVELRECPYMIETPGKIGALEEAFNLFSEPSYPFCMIPAKIAEALRLLITKEKIQFLENQKKSELHNDQVISLAHHHFETVVKPYFEDEFNSHGESSERAVLSIECKIRELIIENIFVNTNEDVKKYILQNKEALINGDEDALKSSLSYFNLNDNACAAWRGYNPFAPLDEESKWPNLLTPQASDEPIEFSTQAATGSLNEIGKITISNLLRERIAYYFLAVMDPKESESLKPNRIVNFIAMLADTRNANGQDTPSCYPETIKRVANIGFLHSIAQLPLSFSFVLKDYFRPFIVEKFRNALLSSTDYISQERLFNAIFSLTTDNALNIALNKEEYSDEQHQVRSQFIKIIERELGCDEHLEEFKQIYPEYILEVDDEIYFEQYLLDPTVSGLGVCLVEIYKKIIDQKINWCDQISINPYDISDFSLEHHVFKILFEIVFSSKIELSRRELNDCVEFIKNKTNFIVKNKGLSTSDLKAILNEYFKDQNISNLVETLTKRLNQIQMNVYLENPYHIQIKALSSTKFISMMSEKIRKLNIAAALFEKARKIFDTDDVDFLKRFVDTLLAASTASDLDFTESDKILIDRKNIVFSLNDDGLIDFRVNIKRPLEAPSEDDVKTTKKFKIS